MKTIDTHGTFADALAEASPEMTKTARALRGLIGEVHQDAVEVPWPHQKNVGYGVGPKKMTEHYCYIGIHAKHVNLGFNFGTNLDDPDGLLEGTGKKFRHVKIGDADEVKQPALKKLLKSAVTERTRALEQGG